MKSFKPGIVTVASGTAVVEWARVRFADIPRVQREARARIDAALARQGVAKAGASMTFSRPPSGTMIEIAPGSLVAGEFHPEGALAVQAIPAGRAAHLRLEGPYDQLPRAWAALTAWVAEQALVPAGLHWEAYGDPDVPVTDLYTLLRAV